LLGENEKAQPVYRGDPKENVQKHKEEEKRKRTQLNPKWGTKRPKSGQKNKNREAEVAKFKGSGVLNKGKMKATCQGKKVD